MSIPTDFEVFRGEDVLITFDVETPSLTGKTLRWAVKDAPDGTAVITKTTGNGITIVSPTLCTVAVLSSELNIATNAGYYHSLVCTSSGSLAVLSHGSFTIKLPRAT